MITAQKAILHEQKLEKKSCTITHQKDIFQNQTLEREDIRQKAKKKNKTTKN